MCSIAGNGFFADTHEKQADVREGEDEAPAEPKNHLLP